MSADELLTEFSLVFENRAFPGTEARQPVSEPDEAPLPAALGVVTWQQVPVEVLRDASRSLGQLSDAGFAYYLPAFMRQLVQHIEPSQQDNEPLVSLLKLPIELDSTITTLMLSQFEAGRLPATTDFTDLLQACFTRTNEAIHRFIGRAAQLTPSQAHAVLQFLTYIKAHTGNREAELAIERYWFQFA